MKKNMGQVDRIFRITFALIVGVLFYLGEISGTAAIILGLLAVIFAVTSFLGFCPLYFPFKLSTLPREKQSA